MARPSRRAPLPRRSGDACRDVGFFYISGHGVPAASDETGFRHLGGLLHRAGRGAAGGFLQRSRRTIAATSGSAAKRSIRQAARRQGGLQHRPRTARPTIPSCWRARRSAPPICWPEMPEFRDTMLDYFNRVWRLGRDLHRGFALDLGLEPDYLRNQARQADAQRCACCIIRRVAAPLVRGQLGAGVHTDYGNVTLLATDAVGGLMVRDRSGRWLDAPVMPGAFVCNIGDCLMRWSNDVYVSTPHKVVNPPARTAIRSRSSSIPIPTPSSRACRPASAPTGRRNMPPITRRRIPALAA